ncbi:MAG TPA: AMP-binding protein [Pseudonocardiaceae bacterium]|nr:AMP-binding protein [Pseudonocardiaceae bacterium]
MRPWELPQRVGALLRAGLMDPLRPDDGLRMLLAVRTLGPLAGPARVIARRRPDTPALVDERGTLSYGDLDRRSNALARAWAGAGLGADAVIAVLCRDHRGLIDCLLAGAKLGARMLLLNTGFGAKQLADVAERENVSALVHDAEFTELLRSVDEEIPRYLGWTDEPAQRSLDRLIEASDGADRPDPSSAGSLILLTSGTTGTPKGAARQVRSVFGVTHFVERVPWRAREATFIGTPVFHATGLSHLILAFALGSTVVVGRRFDPEQTLRMVWENRCTGLVLVPTMLRRILELPRETLDHYDTSRLRIILTAGSALTPDVCERTAEAFGEVLYNLYGSTEVAVATVATPAELRSAPGTVGKPPRGCVVRLFDDKDRPITRTGVSGRIFVGSELAFGGYSGGGDGDRLRGMLASGDLGHFDTAGRLFVDGRDDDMIVSGGENVFPGEIENLLLGREDVRDAAVVGVPDEDFGQRLKAFVVRGEDSTLDEDTVRDYVKANLARYKVPREVVFLDELPHNQTGKVLRKELIEG